MVEFEGHVATRHCAVVGAESAASSKHCFLIPSQCEFGTIFTMNFHLHALIFRNPEKLLNWWKNLNTQHLAASIIQNSIFTPLSLISFTFCCVYISLSLLLLICYSSNLQLKK